MTGLVVRGERLAQRQRPKRVRIADAAVAECRARRLKRRLGRRMGRLSHSHRNDGMAGLTPKRRLGQHIHGVEGFDIAALG